MQKYSRWNVIKCLWNLFKRKFGTTNVLESSVSVEIIQWEGSLLLFWMKLHLSVFWAGCVFICERYADSGYQESVFWARIRAGCVFICERHADSGYQQCPVQNSILDFSVRFKRIHLSFNATFFGMAHWSRDIPLRFTSKNLPSLICAPNELFVVD